MISISHTEHHPLNEESNKELAFVKKLLSAVKDLVSGIRPVLEVTKEVSDPLPPLKAAVSGVLAVWKIYDVCTIASRPYNGLH